MYCTKCGSRLDANSRFCFVCGTKQEIQNIQMDNINSNKKNKLTKKLGGLATVLCVLGIVIIFLGVFLCFPDPNTGENLCGLSYDIFGKSGTIMMVAGIVLAILSIKNRCD